MPMMYRFATAAGRHFAHIARQFAVHTGMASPCHSAAVRFDQPDQRLGRLTLAEKQAGLALGATLL